VLSPEARDRSSRTSQGAARERQAFLEDGRPRSTACASALEQQARRSTTFQVKVRPLVEQLAKERGYDLVSTPRSRTRSTRTSHHRRVVAKAEKPRRPRAGRRPRRRPGSPRLPKPAPKP